MKTDPVFNPLDKRNLGKSIVQALIEQPFHALNQVSSFCGAGVYSIYYRGNFVAYEILTAINTVSPQFPIYVGKAVPKGGRKGNIIDESVRSKALFNRLQQHCNSVNLVRNLNIEDFTCRYLVVDEIWIGLGEALLIQQYKPLWNQVVEGFGNHDPGSGRYSGKRPLWDELHPGRPWAERCEPANLCETQILSRIKEYMSGLNC